MSRLYRLVLTLAGLVGITRSAYAVQPPNVVVSDGYENTAMGTDALKSLVTPTIFNPDGGYDNTAAGAYALAQNTTGADNTAMGYRTLLFNTTGYSNSALGSDALLSNSTGFYNTAVGQSALVSNTTAGDNSASGAWALAHNTTGNDNTATGFESLESNKTGSNNTGVGANALGTNEGGSNNIAVGFKAGYYVRGGRYNIEIGNVGGANDSGTIRIGTSSQQATTYIAGIVSSHVNGSAVYVTANGQLGVLASSERYKTGVASMGSSSERIRQLRPVTYRLKSDRKGQTQYGLIAEEVAKVYPELVIRGEQGQIEGVRYEELTPMLLNEIQRLQEQRDIERQQLRDMQRQLTELQEFRRSMQGRATGQ